VSGCCKTADSEFIIAGMEQAYVDGMEIMNLSTVSPVRWVDGPDGLAVGRLERHGILVVAAAGNDGNIRLWATSSPGLADNALSIAAINSSKYLATVLSANVLLQNQQVYSF
jgi:subtilisin family serine protease